MFIQVNVPVADDTDKVGWLMDGLTVNTNEEIQPVTGWVELTV